MSITQLTGSLKMGVAPGPPTNDVSQWVTRLTIQRTREGITVAGTLATGVASTVAGAEHDNLIIDFYSDLTAAGPFSLFETAIMTPNAELLFEGTLDPDVVSATNPKWSGTAIILGVDIGGTVGQLRGQSQTFPIKGGTLVKAVT
jgi:hypothetical protein